MARVRLPQAGPKILFVVHVLIAAALALPVGVQAGPPLRLHPVARTLGPNDPHDFDLSQLIPRRSRLRQVWYLHGGREPDQVLVEWIQTPKVSLYGDELPSSVRWGLTLWTQAPLRANDFQAPWRGTPLPLIKWPPGAPGLQVRFADVTGDGHPDVLYEQWPGTNHGCGPHQIVATLGGGQVWRVFNASPMCETSMYGVRGLLGVDLPLWGPHDSMCCWSRVQKVRMRWTGRRYALVSARVVRVR
jgi:hypothetical protein